MVRIGQYKRLKNKSFNKNEDYFKYVNKHPEINIVAVRYIKGKIYMTYVQPLKIKRKRKKMNRKEINSLIKIDEICEKSR